MTLIQKDRKQSDSSSVLGQKREGERKTLKEEEGEKLERNTVGGNIRVALDESEVRKILEVRK